MATSCAAGGAGPDSGPCRRDVVLTLIRVHNARDRIPDAVIFGGKT